MSTTSSEPKKGVARLWQLALKQRVLVLLACVLSIISTVCAFLPFIAIYFIIEALLVHLSKGTALDGVTLIRYGWLACGAAILAIALNFAALACSHMAAFRTLYELKLSFVKHLSSLPLGFHSAHSTGELRKIVDDNIEKVELFIAHQLPDIVGSFVTPIVLLCVLLFFDWRLGLATLVPVLLSYVVMFRGYGQKGAAERFDRYQKQLEIMNNVSVEYVRGISVIKAFNQTFFSFRKFYEAVKAYTDFCLEITYRFKNTMSLFLLLLNHAYLFLIPVVIWLSGSVDNYFEFALAVVFYLIFSVSIPGPFMKLMYVSNLMRQVVSSVEHMDNIFAAKPLPAAENPQLAQGSDVRFDHVSFSYGQNASEATPAIADVSFVTPQGTMTALVGASGSGKSTVAHLIPRFFDVDKGSIQIGGVDIRHMPADALQSLVSFVFQDVFLFKESILENLRIGNPRATREQVIEAAKAAQCHDFVEALPQGYDTVVGSQGIHLSGGEQQRLVFARAIVKNSPILILDEATAFADPENEYKIQQAMSALMKGRTTIVIAHRLSSIVHADQILVLDQGRIVEAGRHEELLAHKGRYSDMWGWYTRTLQWQITAKTQGDQHVQA